MARLRVLAVGGGKFSAAKRGRTPLAFILADGITVIRLIFRDVEIDGLDATTALLDVLRELGGGVDVLLAGSAPVAGFNIIDPRALLREGGVPSIFVLRERPDWDAVEGALRGHFSDWEGRLGMLKSTAEPREVELGGGEKAFIACSGIAFGDAARITRRLTLFGKMPEPLRVASAAARALTEALDH